MFQAGCFHIVVADEIDLAEIRAIYNSNRAFLLNHTGSGADAVDLVGSVGSVGSVDLVGSVGSVGSVDSVDDEWCLREYREMLGGGFLRCMILGAEGGSEGGPAIGFMDFKVSEETYLSLLMLLGGRQRRGIGREVYRGFEEYIRGLNSKRIRIDVVTGYDGSSLGFWLSNGFVAEKEVMLSWGENKFPAQKMIKEL